MLRHHGDSICSLTNFQLPLTPTINLYALARFPAGSDATLPFFARQSW
jgi:hypothetical protein